MRFLRIDWARPTTLDAEAGVQFSRITEERMSIARIDSLVQNPRQFTLDVEKRVERALGHPGALALVGYDANGIQDFVTRATAIPYLRGASALVKEFDRQNEKVEGCLFAAGGRGRLLVTRMSADALVERLRAEYSRLTGGEVLATAYVPFDPAAEYTSIRWLDERLAIAKDEAPSPGHTTLGDPQFDHCGVCQRRPVAPGHFWSYGEDEKTPVCRTCAWIIKHGKRDAGDHRERGKSLVDLSTTNRVAVLSADGNHMGGFFGSLTTLRELAIASSAISVLFEGSLIRALDGLELAPPDRVTPVVGGDDLRLFVGPERIFEVVQVLVETLEGAIDRCARLLGFSAQASERFAKIGIGVGLVIGPDTHPAALAIDQAHKLEESAKQHCRDHGFRSAIDFIHLRSGDELIAGASAGCHPLGLSLDRDASANQAMLADVVRAAISLTAVPTSQRAMIMTAIDRAWNKQQREDAARSGGPPQPNLEFLNLLRYQVARSPGWRNWFGEQGVDWRDSRVVDTHAPTHAMLEIARVQDLVNKSKRRGAA